MTKKEYAARILSFRRTTPGSSPSGGAAPLAPSMPSPGGAALITGLIGLANVTCTTFCDSAGTCVSSCF